MLNSDRWSQCIFTQIKREMGALIKFYMWVINSHKINEEWLRAVRQIADQGGLQSG